jgi:hypothetical protein
MFNLLIVRHCGLVDLYQAQKETADIILVNSTIYQGRISWILDAVITKTVTLIFWIRVQGSHPKYFGLVPPSIQQLWQREAPVDSRTTMSTESVCHVARCWVDVGSFHTRLFLFSLFLQRQSGIFWRDPRMFLLWLSKCQNAWTQNKTLVRFTLKMLLRCGGLRTNVISTRNKPNEYKKMSITLPRYMLLW